MMYKANIDYDIPLEVSILGICLLQPHAFGQIYGMLNRDCFYDFHHQKVYDAIKEMFNNGYPIDLVTVTRHFYDKGVTEIKAGENTGYYLTMLTTTVTSDAHLEYWCLKLRELSAKRLMISITSGGYKSDDIFDGARDIEDKLKQILEIKSTDDWMHISKVALKATKLIESRNPDVIPGISTSISLLDRLNGGFRGGNLIIIGARPSVGKSAFMGRIATQAAFRKNKVGIISLEMQNEDLFNRMASSESEVDFYKIDRNNLKEETQRQKVYQTISNLGTLPIYFSDTSKVNAWDIRAKAEKLLHTHGLDILIVDYLQLIEADNDKNKNREQEVAKISRGMKLLAKSLNIPIILLAQLNRAVAEGKGDNKPQLHHLRESGSIEQDADVVMFLHRDWLVGVTNNAEGESTERQADLLVRKWRNGAPTEIKIGFEPAQMRFFDLDAEKLKQEAAFENNKPSAGIQRNYTDFTKPKKQDEDVPF